MENHQFYVESVENVFKFSASVITLPIVIVCFYQRVICTETPFQRIQTHRILISGITLQMQRCGVRAFVFKIKCKYEIIVFSGWKFYVCIVCEAMSNADACYTLPANIRLTNRKVNFMSYIFTCKQAYTQNAEIAFPASKMFDHVLHIDYNAFKLENYIYKAFSIEGVCLWFID